MPMSVLEALATGLPIISTDVGGIHDVVKGNGILIKDGDEEALYNAMKKLLNISEKEIYAIKKYKTLIFENYSSKNMTKQYTDLYRKVLIEK